MSKKAITLYVEEDLVTDLKERKFNMSFLFNETMKVYLDNDFTDVEIAARISAFDQLIIEQRTNVDKKHLECELEEGKLARLIDRRQAMMEEFIETQKTLRMSAMIRELNKVIIASEFDVTTVKESCFTMIIKIQEMSSHFNLEKHVERLKVTLM